MTHILDGPTTRDHAFWIARSVARKLGLDLTAALADGRLTASGYAQLVARCEACPVAGACQRWLADPALPAGAQPVAGCANAEDFAALAR
ncbi:hypothetical protein DRV84_14370 [Rhodosalinus sediminis]|jgi:hypothetical protein|uniref:DUF6455 domain-containing protein n=1 Tax=Rhodosalinus sediminis TaxID=1940533 RepID=A0A3D9BKJ4_9RHOB|nr:DUF6455 family protein [Rhodosalinus sediminis]REC54039.1 hypothetical protein DRV84_14370 [Rhodosalinus sediminis]